MATLFKDGLKLEITDITSMYTEEDEPSGAGTYESFCFHVSILDDSILSEVLEERFELPTGNLLSLIYMIGEALTTKSYQEVVFVEPDFSFELIPIREWNMFRFCWWVNSGAWEGIYSSTYMGFRMEITKEELKTFLQQLNSEWLTRKKLPLE